jgi:hypothetical protein
MVRLSSTPESPTAAAAFVERWGLTVGYMSRSGFSLHDINPEALAELRCQAYVDAIYRNAYLGKVTLSDT